MNYVENYWYGGLILFFLFFLTKEAPFPLVRCKEYIKPVYLQENFHLATLNGANNAVSQ